MTVRLLNSKEIICLFNDAVSIDSIRIATDDEVINKWWIGRDLEVSRGGSIKVLSRYLRWGSEDNHVDFHSGQRVLRSRLGRDPKGEIHEYDSRALHLDEPYSAESELEISFVGLVNCIV